MGNTKNSDLLSVSTELGILGSVSLSGRLALAIVGVVTKVDDLRKSLDLARLMLLKGYSKVDNKGEIIPDDKGRAIFKSKEDEDKYFVEYANLMTGDADITYPKVAGVTDGYLESLEGVSPAQLMILMRFKEK